MKKSFVILTSILLALVIGFGITSCKKDEKTTFSLSSIKAGTIDLNTATPPTNLPIDPVIEAVFTVDVMASTANATNIKLKNNLTSADVTLVITVSGTKITIEPADPLNNGTAYSLSMTGLMSTDDQSLSAITRTFSTEGSYAPGDYFAYWNFEGNLNDVLGVYNATSNVNVTFQTSHSTASGQAGVFDGTTSIAEIPNGHMLMNTADFSLCFWVKALSAGHVDSSGNPKGHFVFGLGAFKGFQFEISGDYSSCKLAASYELADATTSSEDLWFAGDGNLGWQGWTYCRDLTGQGGVAALLKDQWAFVTCTYDHATKIGTMYINGEIMKSQDFNLWPAGDPKTTVVGLKYGGVEPEVFDEYAFGFVQSRAGTLWDTEPWGNYDSPYSNHFGGLLDDVRIYHRVLTVAEIEQMYTSSK